ncbi:FAD-dependent oxidoreductase [Streptomyces sp. 5-8]|uniref:FAD-dependent oxidoreductase n=1 Tax=Streptomyces musisoli TaxID=2802280 RepID=A0ABS1NWN7_9ACTN|nr:MULTISPECIES: FAD-dependent oxidoreductase [Streptomyces]MBL1104509.1 FAD-dependent oxidoreductase [Streptomyces musisoli]MBY8840481.1 FAD-dependent oxidoreductase [Streptomyces sp. SP2-10]
MRRTVAVVGGGYGGATVAKALESKADVVLIDPREAFVNAAASLRALTRPEWANNMFFPFATLIGRGRVIRDRAVSVDPHGVTLASGEHVAADYVVLATGSGYAYPAKPTSDSVAEALDDLRRTHKELRRATRVLILGAGPVGLELAGEIKEAWPGKHVAVVDPAGELLPGFQPAMVEDLRGQLDALGIELHLGADLQAPPHTGPGLAGVFTVATSGGERITADIWFRAHGTTVNSGYLADSRLTGLDPRGRVPVTDLLNVKGHAHVYAVGDITDVAEAKMAGYAMQHAEVVVKNITAQLNGERPTATYRPLPYPMVLLPLGSTGGVGQLPSPDGPFVAPRSMVSEYKGADLFTGRFIEQLGPTA